MLKYLIIVVIIAGVLSFLASPVPGIWNVWDTPTYNLK